MEDFSKNDAAAAGYYLSSFLRLHDYDTCLTSQYDEGSLENIESLSPIAVCISSTMLKSKQSLEEIVDKVKKRMPEVPIIVGGGLVWKSYLWLDKINETTRPVFNEDGEIDKWSIFPLNKAQINIDVFIVSSHGSYILLQVLDHIVNKFSSDFVQIPNLAIPDKNGKYLFTSRIDENVDFNNDYTRWDVLDELPLRIPIRSSIGCAYRCCFCDFCQLYPSLFLRSLESLESELQTLRQVITNRHPNILNLFFTDDNVFSSQDRINGICKTLLHSKINKLWAGFIRADQINLTNIKLIKTSGLTFGITGVESGDTEQLNRMNKKNDLEKVSNGIELLDSQNIPVLMTFVVGFPGENEKTIQNTINFVNNLKQQTGMVSYQLYPLNLSPLSLLASPENRKKWKINGLFSKWSHFSMNSGEINDNLKKIFSSITNTNYHYPNESYFFLQRFRVNEIKKMANLRKELTLYVFNKELWGKIAPVFSQISDIFKIKQSVPDASLMDFLVI